LAVVAYHVAPKGLPGGFIGVDVFFVISGYLISNLIMRDIDEGSFSFAKFYLARLRRIFPSLIVVMAATLAFGWLVLFPDEFRQLGEEVLAGSLSVANLLFWRESGYFDVQSILKPMLHLWSLGIEEQFYLFFPLITYLVYRPGQGAIKRTLFRLLMLILLHASLILNVTITDPAARFYLPITRMWELLSGVMMASLFKRRAKKLSQIFDDQIASTSAATDYPSQNATTDQANQNTKTDYLTQNTKADYLTQKTTTVNHIENLLSVLALLAVLAAFSLARPNQAFPSLACLLAVAGTSVLLVVGHKALVNRFFLALWPLRYIGLISYPLYLWHWPMVSMAMIVTFGSRLSDLTRVSIVISSVILSALTYHFVEKPIRFNPKKRRIKHLALGGAITILASLGLWIYLSPSPRSYTTLKDYEPLIFEEFSAPPVTVDSQCVKYLGFRPSLSFFCRYQFVGSDKTVAILGDSHANSAFTGLAEYNESQNVNTIMLGLTANVRPIIGLDKAMPDDDRIAWQEITEKLYDKIISDKSIETVFLVIRGSYYINSEGFPSEGKSSSATDPETYLLTLQKSIDVLIGGGKKVAVVAEYPELPSDPRSYLARPLHPKAALPLKADILKGYENYLALLGRLVGADIILTDSLFCPEQTCQVFSPSGLHLYHDNQHLSKAGSKFQAQGVLKPYLEGESN
jgi:peptidoglycan/LPS O-acetylase OafA/YrhL